MKNRTLNWLKGRLSPFKLVAIYLAILISLTFFVSAYGSADVFYDNGDYQQLNRYEDVKEHETAEGLSSASAYQDYQEYKENPSPLNGAIFAFNFIGNPIPGKSKVVKEIGKKLDNVFNLVRKLGKAEKATDAKPIFKETGKIFEAKTKKEALEYVRGENLPSGVKKTANDFFKDATTKANHFKITKTDTGYRHEFFSPANNLGYGKRYVLEADEAGNFMAEFRDTMGPTGIIERKITKTLGGLYK